MGERRGSENKIGPRQNGGRHLPVRGRPHVSDSSSSDISRRRRRRRDAADKTARLGAYFSGEIRPFHWLIVEYFGDRTAPALITK